MFLKGNETTIELLNATSAVRKFASYWLLSVILMFVMAFGLAATQSTQLLHGDRTELMVLGGFVAGFAFMIWGGLRFYFVSDIATKFDLVLKVVTIKTQPRSGDSTTLILPFENLKCVGLVKTNFTEWAAYSVELCGHDGSRHALCALVSSREDYGAKVDQVCAATHLARVDRD